MKRLRKLLGLCNHERVYNIRTYYAFGKVTRTEIREKFCKHCGKMKKYIF